MDYAGGAPADVSQPEQQRSPHNYNFKQLLKYSNKFLPRYRTIVSHGNKILIINLQYVKAYSSEPLPYFIHLTISPYLGFRNFILKKPLAISINSTLSPLIKYMLVLADNEGEL